MDIIRVLQEYWPSFCKALMITLEMTVFSLIFATIIGTIVGLFNVSKIKPLQFIANIYIDIVRSFRRHSALCFRPSSTSLSFP